MVLKNATAEFHGEAGPGENFAGLQQLLEHLIGDFGLADGKSNLDEAIAPVIAERATRKLVERAHRIVDSTAGRQSFCHRFDEFDVPSAIEAIALWRHEDRLGTRPGKGWEHGVKTVEGGLRFAAGYPEVFVGLASQAHSETEECDHGNHPERENAASILVARLSQAIEKSSHLANP